MDTPPYRRILLKLSGEALQGPRSGGLDFDTLARFSGEVKALRDMNVDVALVVGGGNIFRGSEGAKAGLDKPTGDYMGMLATVINALALQASLEQVGLDTRVLTAIEMRPVAEPFIRRRAIRHLEKGRVVIFGAGTGNPFFTTDTAAALRAKEINADVLLKATKVDGIYSDDPKKNSAATRFETLTYNQALQENLGVMDASAIALCRDNALPIYVFDMTQPGNVIKAVRGEPIGTIVKGD